VEEASVQVLVGNEVAVRCEQSRRGNVNSVGDFVGDNAERGEEEPVVRTER
jgi:hypothetical protein